MDHCFGAGKTSLVWKFRNILTSLVPGRLAAFNESQFNDLKQAIYLHVPFRKEMLSEEFQIKSSQNQLSVGNYDQVICQQLSSVLQNSCNRSFPLCSNFEEISAQLSSLAQDTKFLFHFDDVGAYELPCPEIGIRFLYRLWNVAERLRDRGDFFVITGRSAYLHLIGKNSDFHLRPSVGYESPNNTILISLDVLSLEAIKGVFRNSKVSHVRQWGVINLYAIEVLTGGIPRAVISVLKYVSVLRSDNLPSPDDENLALALQNVCPSLFTNLDYSNILRTLAEFTWAEIDFDPTIAILSGEPIAYLIARLGLYTKSCPRNLHKKCVVMPLFQFRSLSWSPRSLLSIKEYENPGDRLEVGFRRVLHLRLSLGGASNWDTVGLGFLDAFVPYPKNQLVHTYPFPKIVSVANVPEGSMANFMTSVHSSSYEDVNRVIFPRSSLPDLCSLMELGQYYQPLPRSSSADAKIRCSDRAMCDFQFKNFAKPLKYSEVVAEVDKVKMDGWCVFLVIICSAGHEVDGGVNVHVRVKNVDVLLLSKTSVELFFGKNALSTIANSPSLLEDLMKRLTVASPLKRDLLYRNLSGSST